MDREFDSEKPPDKLIARLNLGLDIRAFRRRAVFTFSNDKWWLLCCTVEALSPSDDVPQPRQSRRYPRALLYEDLVTGKAMLDFANKLHEGRVQIGDIAVDQAQNPQWTTEFLPLANEYMARAGHIVSLRVATTASRPAVGALLSPNEPYYPDVADAARDWLPFPVYHGDQDGRNDQIVFLLPESRAYFQDATFSNAGTVTITVGGTDINTLSLMIKGAYWEGHAIRHLDAAVVGSRAELAVPDDCNRLEYVLMDSQGAVYDYQREDRFHHTGLGRRRLTAAHQGLVEQVRRACRDGESVQVEFKPFVDPDQKLKANHQKTKLGEVIVTAVAFANTKGGHIYVGVDDDCVVTGIDQELQAWAKESINESVINRYLGALKSTIKDLVHGEITLRLSYVEIDGALVVVIEVSPAQTKPVSRQQDRYLYVRTGANNQKAPPEQWRSILSPGSPFSSDFLERGSE